MSFYDIFLCGLCFIVCLVWYEYCYPCFLIISTCLKYLFFYPLTFSLCVSFILKCVICRQRILGFCFIIQSATICHLTGAFSPLTFEVIIDICLFISILNLSFQLILYFFTLLFLFFLLCLMVFFCIMLEFAFCFLWIYCMFFIWGYLGFQVC